METTKLAHGVKVITRYDEQGQIVEIFSQDDLVDNFLLAMEVKKSGDLQKAAKMLELSTNPPSIYKGHYEQLFIIYRKFYRQDMQDGNYQAVINRINRMIKLDNEMLEIIAHYRTTVQNNPCNIDDIKDESNIKVTDLKTLQKALDLV